MVKKILKIHNALNTPPLINVGPKVPGGGVFSMNFTVLATVYQVIRVLRGNAINFLLVSLIFFRTALTDDLARILIEPPDPGFYFT